MDEYRYKYYFVNGDVSFRTFQLKERKALERGRVDAYFMKVKKIDLYKGTKKIATFYK
jgi:hypothetical protein